MSRTKKSKEDPKGIRKKKLASKKPKAIQKILPENLKALVHELEVHHEVAVKIILEGDGRTFPEHFDPNLRKAFIELAPAFKGTFGTLED
jgi:hypothetical protein